MPTSVTDDYAGVAWLAVDGDGHRDVGRLGPVNFQIELLRGRSLIRTGTTSGDGKFRFEALPPGKSRLREGKPDWMRWSSTPNEGTVVLAAGRTHTVDFSDWSGTRRNYDETYPTDCADLCAAIVLAAGLEPGAVPWGRAALAAGPDQPA